MMDRVLTGSLLLLLTTTVFGQAADAPKLDEKQLVKLLEPYYQAQAAKYEFFLDEYWTSRILRDNYVTCAMGVLDLEAIKAAIESEK